MKNVFVRVNQITAPVFEETKSNSRKIQVQLLPINDGNVSALSGRDVLTTTTIWSFKYVEPKASYLNFILLESQNPFEDKEIARMVLPLIWFTPNTVVRSSFPMKSKFFKNESITADIDIHLSENGANAYVAPLGNLLVNPSMSLHTRSSETDLLKARLLGNRSGSVSNTKSTPISGITAYSATEEDGRRHSIHSINTKSQPTIQNCSSQIETSEIIFEDDEFSYVSPSPFYGIIMPMQSLSTAMMAQQNPFVSNEIDESPFNSNDLK